MKRVISLLLSVAMLLSIAAGIDFSAYALSSSGKGGENVTYTFDSSTGTLTISGSGDMYDYSVYSNSNCSPFYNNTNIKVVTIENKITRIGSSAFFGCINLKSIKISNSLTKIGGYAFYNCGSLTSITIPNSVTSIGILAFCYCGSLKKVNYTGTIDDWCGISFDGSSANPTCYAKDLYINDVLLENAVITTATKISNYAFYNCSGLTSVAIGNSATSIGKYAFEECSSLTSVTVPDSVISIGDNAFEYCTSLTNITIPDSVTSIGSSAFYNTAYYNDKSNWKNGVLYIDNALIKADSSSVLNKYEIRNNTTVVADYSFSNCSSLTSVTIPDSVKSIGIYAFKNCSSFNKVNYTGTIDSWCEISFDSSSANPTFYAKDLYINDILLENPVISTATKISDYAFYNCCSLTSITIPNSVTSIGKDLFFGCDKLSDIYYLGSEENWNNIIIDDIDYYNDCLSDVTIHYNSILPCDVHTPANAVQENIIEPTCTVEGSYDSVVYCSVCKRKLNGELNTIDATGHKEEIIPAVKPTCTEIGLTEGIKCSVCGDILKEQIVISKTGHSYISTVTLPTCTKQGYTTYVCSQGDDTYVSDLTDALGHSYDEGVITTPSTCTESGIKTYTCSVCGDGYTEEIAKLSHTLASAVEENRVEPTCTVAGSYDSVVYCSVCKKEISRETKTINATGHNYIATVTAPTCTNQGYTTYVCSQCDNSYTSNLTNALGHSYNDGFVTTQPTCTSTGIKTFTCNVCGYSYTRKIAKLPHTPADAVQENIVDPKCEIEGSYDSVVYCSVCNTELSRESKTIDALEHIYDEKNVKIVIEPTYEDDGVVEYICQRCGDTYEDYIEQLLLEYNTTYSNYDSQTYKINLDKSGFLTFNFEGESADWNICIYDEDWNNVDTLYPVFKEFYKKSYLQAGVGSTVPNESQITALLAGNYYVQIVRVDDSNDNYSGFFKFSIDYHSSNETITETKDDFYYDAPTAKDVSLNKTYNGFLGGKYCAYTYSGSIVSTVDGRDAYKFEIPKGSGWSQLSVTLSTKTFPPIDSSCTISIYNSDFDLCEDFTPMTISAGDTKNEIAYLYEGVYYIAVSSSQQIEYTFSTALKPTGTFLCETHKYKLVETKNPTCSASGYNRYVCAICNTEYKEVLPATSHNIVIDEGSSPTCITTGLTEGTHCSICGKVFVPQTVIEKTSHTYIISKINKATTKKDGSITKVCDYCGKKSTQVIYYSKTITLSATSYTYDGKTKKPTVTVKDSKGNKIATSNYTVTYASGCKNVGSYNVTIKFKGNYSGTVTKTFKINPKNTSISSVTAKSKGFTVKWKKYTTQTTGYQIQYSTSSNFNNAKTVTVSKNSTTSTTVSKLSAKKKYYVRIRTYKTVNGAKYYSSWSSSKAVTTKK